MSEVEINGKKYRIDRLNAIAQFHLARRLAPLLKGLGEGISSLPDGEEGEATESRLWSAFGPVASALSEMTDSEINYILNTCMMKVHCYREDHWAPMMTAPGRLQFENEVELPDLIQITMAVIRENLGTFFPDAPPPSSADGASQ